MATREEKRVRSRSATLAALALGAAVLAAIVAALAAGLDDDGGGETAAAPTNATVEQLLTDATRYFDRRVSVAGQVREVLGSHAFLVGGSPFFAGDELLVVTEEPVAVPSGPGRARPLLENDVVGVVGELRPFERAEFEEAIGAQLQEDLGRRDGDPALLAEEIDLTPRLVPIARGVEPADLARSPERYEGTLVSVDGRVSDALGPYSFVLADSVVVVAAPLQTPPREGERLRVVGTVRMLDRDQLRALAGEDLDENLYGDLLEKPAVVADTVERLGRGR